MGTTIRNNKSLVYFRHRSKHEAIISQWLDQLMEVRFPAKLIRKHGKCVATVRMEGENIDKLLLSITHIHGMFQSTHILTATYADDTAFIGRHEDSTDASLNLQHNLQKIYGWCKFFISESIETLKL